MDPQVRVINRLPTDQLWDDNGIVEALRHDDLDDARIKELLRCGEVKFVVLEVGKVPVWIAQCGCFAFWKDEVRPHLADPSKPAFLEAFPSHYLYFASEWYEQGELKTVPIIVLEKHH